MTERYYVPDIGESECFTLPPEESHHAASVMRVGVGDTLHVFDGSGREGIAEVISVTKKSVQCLLQGSMRLVDRERHPPVRLAVALPKGDRQRVLIEKAVELGATSLTPVICQRSVVRPDPGATERLERIVIEASKQCGRNQLMEIGLPQDFKAFMKSAELTAAARKWIAHPGGITLDACATESKMAAEAGEAGPDWYLIGPEGGFTDDEVRLAVEGGWRAVSLGPRILRTETAALALLAQR